MTNPPHRSYRGCLSRWRLSEVRTTGEVKRCWKPPGLGPQLPLAGCVKLHRVVQPPAVPLITVTPGKQCAGLGRALWGYVRDEAKSPGWDLCPERTVSSLYRALASRGAHEESSGQGLTFEAGWTQL